ncbi:MAG TPA: HDOD domain-containing protein, partial [Acidimicrobiia bacterium]|nr:HDOD domain-containing protein [Acidimicrobiia bacterium]
RPGRADWQNVGRDVLLVGEKGPVGAFPSDDGGRLEWCSSPVEAIDRLRSGAPVDVVVAADLPGMDGVNLLARLRDEYPSVARIVVAPPPAVAVGFRIADLAHQVIPAGSPPETLGEALRRTLHLREMLADEHLRALAGSVDGLPSLPRIYGDLTAALESPHCGSEEIAAVVCRDPALAAKVLQLVNSSFFGLPRQVTALPEAVAFLGVTTLRSLVLSTEALSLFRPAARAAGLDVDALSVRASATATTAARLAPPDRKADTFTAGLLSDVGLLLLAAKAPDLLRRDEAEWGFTHAAAGAYLLGLWGLPAAVVEAVAFHHDRAVVGAEVVAAHEGALSADS